MFNPYTFDYRQYIKEYHNIDINESPVKIPSRVLSRDYIDNTYAGLQVEKIAKFIREYSYLNEKLRLYKNIEDGVETYYLLTLDQPILALEHSFVNITSPIKAIENKDLWHFKQYKGLMSYWFDNDIIPTYPAIISDAAQTQMGFNFWKYLYKEYVSGKKSHVIYVIDYKMGDKININNIDEMEEYYANTQYNSRFVLERIK